MKDRKHQSEPQIMMKLYGTPRIRFPGFSDTWRQVCLGEVANKGYYGLNAASEEFDGVNKYLRITDIDEGSREFIQASVTSPAGALDDSFLLQEGDIVFVRTGASTGKTYLYKVTDGKVYFAGFLIRFRPEKISPYFVYAQTLRHEYAKWIATVSARSGQPGVNAKEYEKFTFYIPSKKEQIKIVDFLMTVERKIAILDKKVELLKQYKKCVTQKLFTQQIRFKDDNSNSFPDWQEKQLGKVFSERSERGGSADNMLSVTINSGIVPFSTIARKDNSNDNKDNYKKVEVGDIAYNSMRMWQGASGVSQFAGIVSPAYTILKPNADQVPQFFGYYFKLPRLIKLFERYSQGLTSDTWNLKYPQIAKIVVNIPQKAEQQKIADFLASVDDRIKSEQTKLDKARNFKKTLLQRMFV